ncbi:cytochrome P450 [Actinospica acidiphila]|uniref:cytochrome P450 n=1 Tax=Actinospica acidiphila TaxID=304899 RepID=UPI00193EF861|nr:cytochrome P450 [Actinospica acidiphila]MBM4832988.1 cytochrome P450 [Actinospica acidiphila]
MIKKYRDQDMYDRREMCNLTRLLMNGGHETSTAMIAIGVMTLLEHPEQLERLKANPQLVPGAVEELLRYLSPATWPPRASRWRTCRSATSWCARARASSSWACRPTATRGSSRTRHVRPGARRPQPPRVRHGLHHCIGSDIARTELEIVMTTLFRRIPDLRLAKHWSETALQGRQRHVRVYEMPVTW